MLMLLRWRGGEGCGVYVFAVFLCLDWCWDVLHCWCVFGPVPLQPSTNLDRLALIQDFALPDLHSVCLAVVQFWAAEVDHGDLIVTVCEAFVQELCCCLIRKSTESANVCV